MRSYLLWLTLVALLLTGCAQGMTEIRPPEIRYGEDLCAECNMIISDPRFAAAYSLEMTSGRYQQVAFDDIGELLTYATKHPEQKIAGAFVHDFATEEWIDATTAHFVVSSAIATPMNYGIAAFATQEAADAKASENNGEILDWATLQKHAPTMQMGGH